MTDHPVHSELAELGAIAKAQADEDDDLVRAGTAMAGVGGAGAAGLRFLGGRADKVAGDRARQIGAHNAAWHKHSNRAIETSRYLVDSPPSAPWRERYIKQVNDAYKAADNSAQAGSAARRSMFRWKNTARGLKSSAWGAGGLAATGVGLAAIGGSRQLARRNAEERERRRER